MLANLTKTKQQHSTWLLAIVTISTLATWNCCANGAANPPDDSAKQDAPDSRADPVAKELAALSSADLINQLSPNFTNLFNKDLLHSEDDENMDCHLRNMELCMAGMMGSMQRILPETEVALERRCDEVKVSTACVSMFNKKCGSNSVFSALAPVLRDTDSMLKSQNNPMDKLNSVVVRMQPKLESLVLRTEQVDLNNLTSEALDTVNSAQQQQQQQQPQAKQSNYKLPMSGLQSLCEPGPHRNTSSHKALRQRLFQFNKCVNDKVPSIIPCIDDLKVAIQIFYDKTRSLPLKPSCCAFSRFRDCAKEALDKSCGLNSFEYLIDSLTTRTSSMSLMKAADKMCLGTRSAEKTLYCAEVLPPKGTQVPQSKRRSSRFARMLELFSFSPQAQAGSIIV